MTALLTEVRIVQIPAMGSSDGTDYQTDESGYDESGDSGYDNSDYSEEDGYYDEDGDFHYYE